MSPIAPLALWIAIAAMIAVALAFVLPRLVARGVPSPGPSRKTLTVDVYRSHLADLERDRNAGTLAEDEYARARSELERRLLDEVDDEVPPSYAARRTDLVAIAVALPVAAVALYLVLGNPAAVIGAPTNAAMSPARDADAFRRQLAAHLAGNPGDGRGWVTLARLDMEADRFDAAAASYGKALAASAKIARDAGIWCEYADALGMAQGGRLVGKPAELIEHALRVDAAHPKALEMAGSAAYERGDFRAAARYWKQLSARFPPDSEPHRELAQAIARAERLAAMSPAKPEAAPGG